MKTLSGKISFVALALIAIAGVLGFLSFAMASRQQTDPHYKFSLSIGGPGKDDYVELRKSKTAFDTALKALKNHGGQYTIRFKDNNGKVTDPYIVLSIKTDEVTKLEVASSTAAGASAANDPSSTQHLYSDSAADIGAVLDTFK